MKFPTSLFDAALRKSNRSKRPCAWRRGYDGAWWKARRIYATHFPMVCAHCGYAGPSRQMHLDHKVALDKGGTSEASNLQWLCGPGSPNNCHGRKTGKVDRQRTTKWTANDADATAPAQPTPECVAA